MYHYALQALKHLQLQKHNYCIKRLQIFAIIEISSVRINSVVITAATAATPAWLLPEFSCYHSCDHIKGQQAGPLENKYKYNLHICTGVHLFYFFSFQIFHEAGGDTKEHYM